MYASLGPDLTWSPTDPPALAPGAVRIHVAAAGVNRADLSQRAGHYPPPPGASEILGLEVSGTIAEVAPDVTAWRPGDRVCALLAGGGYASEVVVPAGHCLRVPDAVDLIDAAGFIEVFATAWLNLARLAGLADRPPGARIVLHAGASGVGTAAVQLLGLLGHRSFTIVGNDAKLAACRALGADAGHVRHAGPWLAAVRAWAPAGVDAILDPVGGATLADDLAALAPDGAVVLIGLLGGRRAELDLAAVLMRRLRVIGSTLRARDDAFKANLVADLAAYVLPAWADGRVRVVLHRAWPIEAAAEAHAELAADATIGKIVLTVG
jgi:putative PIG3 family NAD(P)H quinone oxidoreductase